MTSQPTIIFRGWDEASRSLSKTGFFEEHQLNPATVLKILGDLVRRYSATIGYGYPGCPNPFG